MPNVPLDLFAERAVLGCILISPQDALPKVADQIGHTGQMFSLPGHARMYELILQAERDGRPVDEVVLLAMMDKGMFDDLGRSDFIAQAMNAVPTSANAGYYAAIVRESWGRRRFVEITQTLSLQARGAMPLNDQFLEEAEKSLETLFQRPTKTPYEALGDQADSEMAALEHVAEGRAGSLSTGIPVLDKLLWNVTPGSYTILAARPSVGKTAFALGVTYHLGSQKIPIHFFSLEMGTSDLRRRLWTIHNGASMAVLRARGLAQWRPEQELARFREAQQHCAGLPIYIDGSGDLTMADIRSRAREMTRRHGLGLIVCDYLQLIRVPRSSQNRNVDVAEISRAWKALAKELQQPVLVLSQLSREGVGHPRLQHLRDSGALEQDADNVLLMWPDSEDSSLDPMPTTMHLAKQRNGPTGRVSLMFQRERQRFMALEREEPPPPETEEPPIPFDAPTVEELF